MAGKYSANNELAGTQQNLSTSYKTLLSLTSSTGTSARRAGIYHVVFGTGGTPVDIPVIYDISAQTAAGTSTSVTPIALDQADGACLIVGTANFTAEGTITATSSRLNAAVNARATFQWMAADADSMIIIPATNLAGFAHRAKSPSYAAVAVCTSMFQQF